jgi:hypothetical protein
MQRLEHAMSHRAIGTGIVTDGVLSLAGASGSDLLLDGSHQRSATGPSSGSERGFGRRDASRARGIHPSSCPSLDTLSDGTAVSAGSANITKVNIQT